MEKIGPVHKSHNCQEPSSTKADISCILRRSQSLQGKSSHRRNLDLRLHYLYKNLISCAVRTCSALPVVINPKILGDPRSSALTFGEMKSKDLGTAEVSI